MNIKKTLLAGFCIAASIIAIPYIAKATQPSDFNLKEGDVISATGDPDVYIVNAYGYKRLFVNPKIFNLYGHLGWDKIKKVSPATRDAFTTSGLFRNCESNDQKVYGLDVVSEDVANLRWVNTSGAQAVVDDPNFFKKVFCINTAEQRLYASGTEYTSVRQIPDYNRAGSVSGAAPQAQLVVPNKIVAGYETTILIKGSGFSQGTQVDFGAGAIKPSYAILDDGQIKVTIPANMPALVYNIAITNPNGQSIILKDALTIQQPPIITSSAGITVAQIFSKVSPSTALITNNSNTTAGSGAVISSDGYILTNEHVISGYSTVKVYISSTGNAPFTQYTGTILGQDPINDLAIVKISASGLQPIEFGSSSETNLPGGSQIYALGFPLVFNIGATSVKILDGIVVGRLGTSFIQVSANIQPGNSGGPLVNNQGKLVGINNSCIKTTKYCQQGYGFAIPVDFINPLIAGLKSPRYTPPPTPPPTPLPTIPPTPTPTPTPTPIQTPIPSATPTPTPSPSTLPTPTPTPSSTPSQTPTPLPTPVPKFFNVKISPYSPSRFTDSSYGPVKVLLQVDFETNYSIKEVTSITLHAEGETIRTEGWSSRNFLESVEVEALTGKGTPNLTIASLGSSPVTESTTGRNWNGATTGLYIKAGFSVGGIAQGTHWKIFIDNLTITEQGSNANIPLTGIPIQGPEVSW